MTETNSPVDLEMVIRHRQIASLRSKLKKTRGKERIRQAEHCTMMATKTALYKHDLCEGGDG